MNTHNNVKRALNDKYNSLGVPRCNTDWPDSTAVSFGSIFKHACRLEWGNSELKTSSNRRTDLLIQAKIT